MTLPLTPEKIQRVIKTFQNLFRSYTTVVELKNSSNSFTTIPELNPFIHYTNSGTCRDSVTISSTTTNFVSKEKKKKKELSVSKNIKHQIKNQINLVDREFEVLQWPNFFLIAPTSSYSNRHFPDRVGTSLQRGSNIRAMVRG